MNFTPSNLFGQVLFGAIGMGAFVYGKKQAVFKAMILGIVLMIFPYFVPETWMLYTISGVLTLCLFTFRE